MSCLPQIDEQILASMAPEELRALTTQLLARIEQDAQRAAQAKRLGMSDKSLYSPPFCSGSSR